MQNYLVPIDAKLDRERDLEFETVKLDFVLRKMELEREGKTSIVILDACRDNPLTRNLARTMGTRSAAIVPSLPPSSDSKEQFFVYAWLGKISWFLASAGSRLARIGLTPLTGVT